MKTKNENKKQSNNKVNNTKNNAPENVVKTYKATNGEQRQIVNIGGLLLDEPIENVESAPVAENVESAPVAENVTPVTNNTFCNGLMFWRVENAERRGIFLPIKLKKPSLKAILRAVAKLRITLERVDSAFAQNSVLENRGMKLQSTQLNKVLKSDYIEYHNGDGKVAKDCEFALNTNVFKTLRSATKLTQKEKKFIAQNIEKIEIVDAENGVYKATPINWNAPEIVKLLDNLVASYDIATCHATISKVEYDKTIQHLNKVAENEIEKIELAA